MIQNSQVRLRLLADIPETRLQSVTRDLVRHLNDQQGLRTELDASGEPEGAKGDPVTIGAIVLQLLAGGGVIVALIDVLKTYVQRVPSLEFTIERPDGGKLTLKGSHLTPEQSQQTLSELKEFFKSGS